jgi:purine-binding chemotaxis protein CheW
MTALAFADSRTSALATAGTREFVTVWIGGQLFGFEVGEIQDVFAPQALTPVPGARPAIAGILNLRGRIVTAIDTRRCLALPARPEGFAGVMAVGVERDGEAFGLLVDSVGDVMRLADDAFEPNPLNLDPHWKTVSRGVYRLEGRLLLTLDIDRLLSVTSS